MGMWAIFAAPLLMSNDLRSLSGKARNVLLNEAAISVNQDPLGENFASSTLPSVSMGIVNECCSR